MTNNPAAEAPASVPVSRVHDGGQPEQVAAPLRRQGQGSGYPGKVELFAAFQRYRSALAKLARDPDPDARVLGARMVEETTALLDDLAQRAEQATTRHKRLVRQVAEAEPRVAAQLAALRERLGRSGTIHG